MDALDKFKMFVIIKNRFLLAVKSKIFSDFI